MKILFIAEYYHPKIFGGGEINLHLMAKTLSGLGNEVHVATSYFKGLKKTEIHEGVVIRRVLRSAKNVDNLLDNFKRSIIYPRSIYEVIPGMVLKEGFDVIHFIGSGVRCARIIKNKTLKQVFTTVESYLSICPKGDLLYKGISTCTKDCNYSVFSKCFRRSKELGKMRNRFYLKNMIAERYIYDFFRRMRDSLSSTNIIAVSKFIKERLESLGLSAEVIPNIIEVDDFDLKKPNNARPKILYLGSFTAYKGVMTLIQALDGIACDAEFFGEGTLGKEMKKVAKTLKKAKVSICRQVPYSKIPGLYQKADIVVFPSVWPEPFGRISVEAMASGTAVIGSKIGGISDTIAKGCGILVTPGDVKELHDAIAKLIKSKKLRNDMGKEGKAVARKRYAPEIVGKKLLRYYERCK